MPSGAPTPWKIDPLTGAILPYYEGSFRTRGGNTMETDAAPRYGHQVQTPEYKPEGLRFVIPDNAPADPTGRVVPNQEIGGIWGDYSDPTDPDSGPTRVMVRATPNDVVPGSTATILDANGNSDLITIVSPLPRVGANTNAGTPGVEVCRWTFTVPPRGTGMYGAAISGQGSANAAGSRYFQVLINEVLAGYMDHAFTASDINQYRTFTTSLGAYTNQRLTAGIAYLIRILAYPGAGYAPFTDGTNIFQGLVYRWAR